MVGMFHKEGGGWERRRFTIAAFGSIGVVLIFIVQRSHDDFFGRRGAGNGT